MHVLALHCLPGRIQLMRAASVPAHIVLAEQLGRKHTILRHVPHVDVHGRTRHGENDIQIDLHLARHRPVDVEVVLLDAFEVAADFIPCDPEHNEYEHDGCDPPAGALGAVVLLYFGCC